MMCKLTLRGVTYQGYPIQYPSAVSSGLEEIDINDIWNSLLSVWIQEKRFRNPFLYPSLMSLHEIDRSSVRPHFEVKNDTSLIEEAVEKAIPKYISEEDIVMEMVEHDFIVRMPPKKRYIVELEVKDVRKGEPRIVEPEEF